MGSSVHVCIASGEHLAGHRRWRPRGVAHPRGTKETPLAPRGPETLQDANSHVDNLLVWAHGGGFMLLGESPEALLRPELR